MAVEERGGELRAASLLVSVIFHALVGLAVAVSSWWWAAPTLEVWKTHTVSLVDAPLSLQQQTALPKAPPPKALRAPQQEDKVSTPAPAKPDAKTSTPPPVKPESKTPAPTQKPAVAKPGPKTKAKSPAHAKTVPPKPESESRTASSREVRSTMETLRQRQAEREQDQQQAQATQREAASERVATLRDQLKQQEAVGTSAVMAAGVQRVRLMAYQDRVRAKIIEAWILPLSAEQSRDLHATAQFQVTRNGNVTQLELVKPSGNPLFDASLLRAIHRASPLPALPDDYPIDILEVEMRFRADS